MRIRNDGPVVVETDYWQTEHGQKGALYLSINAGAFRLLVPPLVEGDVPLEGVVGAAVSRGPWPDEDLADALEILLDDETQSPFAAHLSRDSVDRMPNDEALKGRRGGLRRIGSGYVSSPHRHWLLTVWHRDGELGARCALSVPCTYRRASRLPDLRPWDRR